MKKIKIDFCDFGDGFVKTENWFTHILKRRFEIEICDRPQFLFFAQQNQHMHRVANCHKIYFGIESEMPDWSECDFALTCHHLNDPRQYRLPFYALSTSRQALAKSGFDPGAELARKKGFCSFVVSNGGAKRRIDFFKKLSRYKCVASGGSVLNNIGGRIPGGQNGKREFLRDYKFNICFENKSQPGYATEKLVEAMESRTVPIYWGDPRIGEDFNVKSFINALDYPSDEALIEHIIHLDQDDNAYREILSQQNLPGTSPKDHFDFEPLLDFFELAFATKTPPASSRRKMLSLGRWRFVKQNKLHSVY